MTVLDLLTPDLTPELLAQFAAAVSLALLGFFWCCAPPLTCSVFTDNFAGSGSVSASWDEYVGSWARTSNRLDPPSDGILRLVQAVPTDSDGYKFIVVVDFEASSGSSHAVRIHFDTVETSSGVFDTSHYLEFTWVDVFNATLQLFSLSGGTPTAINAATSVTDFLGTANFLVEICVDLVEEQITVNVSSSSIWLAIVRDSFTPHSGGVSADRYVMLETVGVNSSMRFDDAELRRLGGSGNCADCEPPLEECSVCENSDEDHPGEALPKIKFSVQGLADVFYDDHKWEAAPSPGVGGQVTWEFGTDGVDDHEWDLPGLDGTYLIPFYSCGDEVSGYAGSQSVVYLKSTPSRSLLPALLYRLGERPLQFNGITPVQPSTALNLTPNAWMTADLGIKPEIYLVKLAGGAGFKIVAFLKFVNVGYWFHAYVGHAWNDTGWSFTGSGFNFIFGVGRYEADWDGDCLAWSGDITLTYVSETSGDAGHTANFSALTVKVGSP